MLYLSIFSLLGVMLFSAFNTAYLQLDRFEAKEFLDKKKTFFFYRLFKKFFTKQKWKTLYFTISSTKHILLLLFATSSSLFAIHLWTDRYWLVGIVLLTFIVAEFSMRSIALLQPRKTIAFLSFFASLYLCLFFIFVGFLLKLNRYLFEFSKAQEEDSSSFLEEKIKGMIKDSEFIQYLEPYDQKLIHSLVSFRKRVAREVMIPRIDVVCLPLNATLSQATNIFLEEEYSRIPIYKESIDEMIGVLLYKDLLTFYAEQKKNDKSTHFSVNDLIKPVIYTPENKKISHLLQEFRNKQTHMAIVVDEYGATEGIITIEDILEEIVGEIEDEYDVDEEELYSELTEGGWLVDAKMSIIDIESKLGINIPQNPEYETIGGYIFHRAGTIPAKGWKLHHDQFELEVISSNDRCIDKIKITPIKKST